MDEEGLNAALEPLFRGARMARCLGWGIYLLVPLLWFELGSWMYRIHRHQMGLFLFGWPARILPAAIAVAPLPLAFLLRRIAVAATRFLGVTKLMMVSRFGPTNSDRRALILAREGLALVGIGGAECVPRGQVTAAYTDGRYLWVEWRRMDGARMAVFGRARPWIVRTPRETIVDEARGLGWQIEDVSPQEMRQAAQRGFKAPWAVAWQGSRLQMLVLFVCAVALLVVSVKLGQVAIQANPYEGLTTAFRWFEAAWVVGWAVWVFYVVPALARALDAAWEVYVPFRDV